MRLGALAHRGETPAAVTLVRRFGLFAEAVAVVGDGDGEPVLVVLDDDLDDLAAAVLGGVGERLLHDAKHRELALRRQARLAAGNARRDAHVGALAEARGIPA